MKELMSLSMRQTELEEAMETLDERVTLMAVAALAEVERVNLLGDNGEKMQNSVVSLIDAVKLGYETMKQELQVEREERKKLAGRVEQLEKNYTG